MRAFGVLDEGYYVDDPQGADRERLISTTKKKKNRPGNNRGGSSLHGTFARQIDPQSNEYRETNNDPLASQTRRQRNWRLGAFGLGGNRRNGATSQLLTQPNGIPQKTPPQNSSIPVGAESLTSQPLSKLFDTDVSFGQNDSWNDSIAQPNNQFQTAGTRTRIHSQNNAIHNNIHTDNQHTNASNSHYSPLSHRNFKHEEEEDDYECCDGCHTQQSWFCGEGAKNLCTIAIWALLVFFIVNRFMMHMSMHYARGKSVARDRGGVSSLEQEASSAVDYSMDNENRRELIIPSNI